MSGFNYFLLLVYVFEYLACGRKNTAKAKWLELPENFRQSLIQFTLDEVRSPSWPIGTTAIVFDTMYGRVIFVPTGKVTSKSIFDNQNAPTIPLDLLSRAIPELVRD